VDQLHITGVFESFVRHVDDDDGKLLTVKCFLNCSEESSAWALFVAAGGPVQPFFAWEQCGWLAGGDETMEREEGRR